MLLRSIAIALFAKGLITLEGPVNVQPAPLQDMSACNWSES